MKFLVVDQNFRLKSTSLRKKKKVLRQEYISQSLNLGFYLVTPIVLGILIGLYLDKFFNLKGIFIIVFIFLGAIASFYNLIKIVRQEK